MSEQKRQELIDAGRLHPDGSRKEVCPTCHKELTQEEAAQVLGDGHAVAQADVHVAGQVDPAQEATE